MCIPIDPMTLITIASSVVGFIGDSQAAADQEQQVLEQQRIYNQQLVAQQGELNEDAAQQTSEATLEARKKRAALRVAAGESGLTGNFIEALEGGVQADLGTARARIEKQRQRNQKQIEREKGGVKSRTQGALNSVERPSIVGTGLQIAGTAFGTDTPKKVTTIPTVHSAPHPSRRLRFT